MSTGYDFLLYNLLNALFCLV